jgi:hypothetical protein
LALNLDISANFVDDSKANGQAQSRPLAYRFGGVKRIENTLQIGIGDAMSVSATVT